jgi:FkbM family methyltransferase
MGYDIQRIDPKRRETLDQAFRQLHRAGMRPASVIDVGVAGGTPELYAAFPDAYYLLVEALAEHEPSLRAILDHVEGEYALVAAASERGSIGLQVSPNPDEHWNSSIFRASGAESWQERQVPAIPLDDLVAERGLRGPFLIKADTEGAELEVLAGATRTLADTLAVVLEVNVTAHLEGAPRLAEVVAFMAERDFVTYDIVGGFNRSSDGALALVDMVFVRED